MIHNPYSKRQVPAPDYKYSPGNKQELINLLTLIREDVRVCYFLTKGDSMKFMDKVIETINDRIKDYESLEG